jgi:hypothetical protein
MNVALWVVTAVLAAVYTGAGIMKMSKSKDQLVATPNMGWAEDFSSNAIKGIGTIEVLGAIGIVLPWLTGIAAILTPVAAVGLAVVQVGAAGTHLRRGEGSALPVNIILLIAAVFLAWGRFG